MAHLTNLETFRAHESHINDIAFTSAGNHLLTAGMDNLVYRWSVPDWERTQIFSGHTKSVNSLSLARDDDFLVTASSDRSVRVWDLATAEEKRVLELRGTNISLSPGDRFLAAVDKDWLTLMDFQADKIISRFKPFPKRTTAIAFSPDANFLAVGGQDDDILIYMLPEVEQPLVVKDAHEAFVLSILFSQNGQFMASTGYEGSLRLWHTDDFSQIGEVSLDQPGVQNLACSPDGSLIAVASDHRVTLVNTTNAKVIQKEELDPKGVYCLAFSPDGTRLACGSADKRVRVWEIRQ